MYQVSVSHLSGFNKLESMYSFSIETSSIEHLTGFAELNRIRGNFEIDNSYVEEMNSFKKLTNIDFNMDFTFNNGITEFQGFDLLDTIQFDMTINYNSSLNDISALNSINTVGQYIQIAGNSNLSDCSINIVCAHIDAGDIIVLSNNKEGCRNKDEAEANCQTLSTEEIKELEVNVFPNPTKDFVNIEYGNIIPQKIELFDMSGRTVLTTTKINSIDMNSLSKGTYILKFLFIRGVDVRKIIKD